LPLVVRVRMSGGGSCPTGYCHLEGSRISNRDAYGAGLISAARP
jgi:hypothetical protein